MTENLINGKKYIGADSKNNPKYIGSGILMKSAIKKYGRENFVKTIIEECSSIEELDNREKFWIEYYEAVNNEQFYNLTEGGISKVPDKRDFSNLVPWNKGLTKETDNRIADIGRKVSKANKNRKIWNKGINNKNVEMICTQCEKKYLVYKSKTSQKFCSRECYKNATCKERII